MVETRLVRMSPLPHVGQSLAFLPYRRVNRAAALAVSPWALRNPSSVNLWRDRGRRGREPPATSNRRARPPEPMPASQAATKVKPGGGRRGHSSPRPADGAPMAWLDGGDLRILAKLPVSAALAWLLPSRGWEVVARLSAGWPG